MEKIKQCKGKVYTWKCRKTQGIEDHGKLHPKAISHIQGHYSGNISAHFGELESMKKSNLAHLVLQAQGPWYMQ